VTRSDVTFRGLDVVALFELGQPRIGFVGRNMQPCGAILFPRLDRVLPESLALFLSVHILGNGFAHDPMCSPLACLGQIFNTGASAQIEFYGHSFGGNLWLWLWHGVAPKV